MFNNLGFTIKKKIIHKVNQSIDITRPHTSSDVYEYKYRDKLHGAETLFRSEHVVRQSRISPHFTAPGGSLAHSPRPATCPYPQPDQTFTLLPFQSLKIYCNIILPSTPRSSKWFLFLAFHHQNTVCSSLLLPTCYITAHLIILDLITRMEFGEECRTQNSSYIVFSTPLLRHFCQALVSSSVFSLVRMYQRQDYKVPLCFVLVRHSVSDLTGFLNSLFLYSVLVCSSNKIFIHSQSTGIFEGYFQVRETHNANKTNINNKKVIVLYHMKALVR